MENYEIYLNNQSKLKENCQKSLTPLDKCNLNSEFKEKEYSDKTNFIFLKEPSSSLPLSSGLKRTHSKPQNFIDNRPNGFQRQKLKTSNEGEYCYGEKREELHKMPITYQLGKIFGNAYGGSNSHRSSEEIWSSVSSTDEGDSRLLERAMSDISLSSASSGGYEPMGGGVKARRPIPNPQWTPDESLLDPADNYRRRQQFSHLN